MTRGKRLFLFRHGKSEWPDDVEDFERPLAPRGIDASSRMAVYMAKHKIRPALALVSTAERARQTWALLEKHLPECEVRFEPGLYEAPGHAIIDLVQDLDDGLQSAMLVGHNPGLQDAAMAWITRDESRAGARLARKFPTAALAVLSFRAEGWAQAAPGSAHLELFVTPKML